MIQLAMSFRRSLLGIALLFLSLSGCKKQEVETYRVPKSVDSTLDAHGHKEIDWTVPKGWAVQPASAMRVGSFLIKASNGQMADVSVIPLSGQAGGDLANINRWRDQIKLGPIGEAELEKQSRVITASGRKMRYVNFVSNDVLVDGKYKKRVIAAFFNQGPKTWFFKLSGEDAAVQEVEPAFHSFLKSVHLTHE